MWHKESFNFDRKKIVVYFERLENVGDKLNYLHWVKYEYLIRPPRIDCNVGLKPKFEEYIDNLRKSISYEEEVYIEGIKRKPVEYEDTAIQRFENIAKQYNLIKGKTIPPETLYEIGKDMKMDVPKDRQRFGPGETTYQILREYASRIGYKRKYKKND